MKTILFATTNDRKIKEARQGCTLFDIEVEPVQLKIDEIQAADPHEIARHKIASAFALTGKPVVVTDTFWNIPSLNGFPGGYMKYVAEWFEAEDFLRLMKGKEDRRVAFTETILYQDEKETKEFSKEYWGVFSDTARGTGNSIEVVAEFNGKTIGEQKEQGLTSHTPEDYIWAEFAKWYSEREK